MNGTQLTTVGTQTQTATRGARSPAAVNAATDPASHPTPPRLLAIPANQPGVAGGAEPLFRRPAVEQRPARRNRISLALGCLLLVVVSSYLAIRYVGYARSRVKTDNAYLAAHIHSVSARVAGTVQEVLVEENQTVAEGAVLARLDSRDFEVRLQQARAQLTQAGAQRQQAKAGIAQAQAQVAREQARATKASNDLLRANSLFSGGSGAISRQELDQARAEAAAAQAALQGAEATLVSADATMTAAQALKEVAQANLQDAQLQLSYTQILAPAAGRIGKKNLERGNHVQPGQPVLALVQSGIWVNANFKETQLTRLKPGQPVEVRVDAFPRRVFQGKVESLAPGSGAQFALLPPDNASGNFTKIVQRVPVKIDVARAGMGDLAGRLVPGMSAVVEVRLND